MRGGWLTFCLRWLLQELEVLLCRSRLTGKRAQEAIAEDHRVGLVRDAAFASLA